MTPLLNLYPRKINTLFVSLFCSLILLNAPVFVKAAPALQTDTPVTISTTPFDSANKHCSGAFVAHTLDHTTTVPGGETVRMFEANGGGVAINDLNHDGTLEIVLANHAGQNTILWNEGSLNFRTERLLHGDSRAVTIIDIDGDGLQDIVFSRRASAPNFWHNQGNGQLELELLPGVSKPLYSINWADLDGDNDLDLVGATYDAGLLTDFGQDFLSSGSAGVYYYENRDGNFLPTRLAGQAQALALLLVDVNQDNHLDILVGNDFAVPDMAWNWSPNGWFETTAFSNTTHSTMSLDAGDINNDGQLEIFATDMKPYEQDAEALSAWAPIMESMMDEPHDASDPQVMENVLQVSGGSNYLNEAQSRGIDATGWSWSGKFADFDQDGYLDLYIVNGMMENTTFAHLPNHELVEQNQIFQNDGTGHFVNVPDWGLQVSDSGRGMSIADLDQDGDLDIVVNNLRSPATLFENQLCSGSSIEVNLEWPDSGNSAAIGATLILHTSTGSYLRQVQAASGYLSGDTTRIHFGMPQDTAIDHLEIRWPDNTVSILADIISDQHLVVTR